MMWSVGVGCATTRRSHECFIVADESFVNPSSSVPVALWGRGKKKTLEEGKK
jgi:hypothetical protein